VHVALATASIEWLESLPTHALCFWRREGDAVYLSLNNLSEDDLSIPLADGHVFTDILSGETQITGEVILGRYGYRWLKLQ
jgi:hypothetical protein